MRFSGDNTVATWQAAAARAVAKGAVWLLLLINVKRKKKNEGGAMTGNKVTTKVAVLRIHSCER